MCTFFFASSMHLFYCAISDYGGKIPSIKKCNGNIAPGRSKHNKTNSKKINNKIESFFLCKSVQSYTNQIKWKQMTNHNNKIKLKVYPFPLFLLLLQVKLHYFWVSLSLIRNQSDVFLQFTFFFLFLVEWQSILIFSQTLLSSS